MKKSIFTELGLFCFVFILLGVATCPVGPDQDRDGVPDAYDNCPTVYNPQQAHFDDEEVGDACQSFNILWGGESISAGSAARQVQDGSYVVTGRIEITPGQRKILLAKIDPSGNPVWQKDLAYGAGHSIWETADGGLIVNATTSGDEGISACALLRTDRAGELLWQRQFNRPFCGDNSLLQTDQQELVMVGSIYTGEQPNMTSDIWVVKTTPDGATLWEKTFDFQIYDEAYALAMAEDGGVILAGISYSPPEPNDIFLMKLDRAGNTEWQKHIGGGYEYAWSIKNTTDGGYVIGVNYDVSHFSLFKTDAAGNEEWHTVFGDRYIDNAGNSVIQDEDDGFILSGRQHIPSQYAPWIAKTDEQGNMLWEKTFDNVDLTVYSSLTATADYGLLLTGDINLHGKDETQRLWLMKTDHFGNAPAQPQQLP
jgi:hypothetical protein